MCSIFYKCYTTLFHLYYICILLAIRKLSYQRNKGLPCTQTWGPPFPGWTGMSVSELASSAHWSTAAATVAGAWFSPGDSSGSVQLLWLRSSAMCSFPFPFFTSSFSSLTLYSCLLFSQQYWLIFSISGSGSFSKLELKSAKASSFSLSRPDLLLALPQIYLTQ